MTAALAKPTIEAAPAAIVLKLRAEARALLWSAGQIGSIPDAVDPLQSFAEESGLVLKIGQDAVQQILADAFLPYRETEWQAQSEITAAEPSPVVDLHCDTCGCKPCVNPSFCAACRAVDARLAAQMATTEPIKEKHPTAQTTIEAIMQAVRVRGPHALTEPENIERLQRCDDAALAEIDRRIEKLETASAP